MQIAIETAFKYPSHRTQNFNVRTPISKKTHITCYTIKFCIHVEHHVGITDYQNVFMYGQKALAYFPAILPWSPKNQSTGIKSGLMAIWCRWITHRWRPWRNIHVWYVSMPHGYVYHVALYVFIAISNQSMYCLEGTYLECFNQFTHSLDVAVVKIISVKRIQGLLLLIWINSNPSMDN